MEKLPSEHKARWFSGAALNSSEAAMQSILSTALSRLNAFLDSELEQVLCFDTKIDAEKFCKQKSAMFLVMPEPNVREISYADRVEIETLIAEKYPRKGKPPEAKPEQKAQKPGKQSAKPSPYTAKSITERHGSIKMRGMGEAIKEKLDKDGDDGDDQQ